VATVIFFIIIIPLKHYKHFDPEAMQKYDNVEEPFNEGLACGDYGMHAICCRLRVYL